MGVYVITQPTLTYDGSGCKISLNCQDKMCLLNGSMGGSIPAPVTFDEYDQEIGHVYLKSGEEGNPPVDDPNTYNVYHYNNKTYMYDKKFGWQIVDLSEVQDTISIKNPIYDIIQTVVMNYGGENITKIMINDIPREIKQIVRFVGTGRSLFFDYATGVYTYDESLVDPFYQMVTPQTGDNPSENGWYIYDTNTETYILTKDMSVKNDVTYYIKTTKGSWQVFNYGDEIGYTWTDFIYPGQLSTGIGDNVCTVLDKIVQLLGNYEYFYDIYGNFVFQEIKNYLNNSYTPLKKENNMEPYYIDNSRSTIRDDSGRGFIANNNILLIGQENYKVDFFGDQKSVYTFDEGNNLVISYSNTPDYTNLKNDFHIWGKNQDGKVLHYHIAIKEKPKKIVIGKDENNNEIWGYPEHNVIFKKDLSNKYTGKIRMIEKEDYIDNCATVANNSLTCLNAAYTWVENGSVNVKTNTSINIKNNDSSNDQNDSFSLSIHNIGSLKTIRANDWRAELYLQGLEKVHTGDRPDKYEQELLDFFDNIYEWGYYNNPDAETFNDNDFNFIGRFKTDLTSTPNELDYFLDYLEPTDLLYGMSVDDIGSKIYSYQQDDIIKMYNDDVPDLILINNAWSREYKDQVQKECDRQGQPFSLVNNTIFNALADNVLGYTAQDTARGFLYQYTTYNESISIQSLPIYYLDVNQRITVEDNKSGIHGDYITKNISLPLVPDSTMSITAVTAINRI